MESDIKLSEYLSCIDALMLSLFNLCDAAIIYLTCVVHAMYFQLKDRFFRQSMCDVRIFCDSYFFLRFYIEVFKFHCRVYVNDWKDMEL